MAALLEKYRKVAGTGPGSTISLADWNGLIDELSTTLAGLVKKGADFDAVATVAIGVLLDRINDVLGPAYDQVTLRGQQVEALYAQISGTGISANSVIESATRLFLTDARRAAILAELRGGVPSDGDTLMELYTAIQAAQSAIGAIPGDVVRYNTVLALTAAQRLQARQNLGALGSGAAGYSAATTLTAAAVSGRLVYAIGTTAFTLTLPTVATFGNGEGFEFVNLATVPVTFAPQGTSNLFIGGSNAPVLYPGQGATFRNDGTNWIVAVHAPAGTTLLADRAQAFTDAQKLQLLTNAGLLIPQMQCRLVRASATQLTLMPEGGNQIWINGAYRTIPAAGIAVTNAGLAASTIYYVYAYWNGAAIALVCSTNAPAIDTTYGIRIPTATPSYTQVGAVYTDASVQFQDNPAQRWVASQYNKLRKEMYGPEVSGSVGTTNVEVNSGGRISWLSLGDQAVDIGVVGEMTPSTFDNCFTNLQLDGGLVGRFLKPTLGGSGAAANISQRISRTVAAGLHYASLAARTGGSSATVTYQMEGEIHG